MAGTRSRALAIFSGVAVSLSASVAGCIAITGTYGDYSKGSAQDGGGGTSAAGGSGGSGNIGGSNFPCATANECPGGSECIVAVCKAGKCATEPASLNQPTVAQTIGDCKTRVCDGAGSTTDIADDTDAPDDGNPCTTEQCQSGTLVPGFAPKTMPCGASNALFCDGKGQCTGCTSAAECGTAQVCQTVTCSAGQCQVANANEGEACGLCKVCTAGVCQNAGAGTVDTQCPPNSPPCGPTGKCDGNGACAIATAGTFCGSNCQGNISTLSLCDGSGQCVAGMPQNCGLYACTNAGCKSNCSVADDCVASAQCTSSGNCIDCTTCGDWLADTQAGGNCLGADCSTYANLVIDCCTACANQCSQDALDMCAPPIDTTCFSRHVSSQCFNCLSGNSVCQNLVNACQADTGH